MKLNRWGEVGPRFTHHGPRFTHHGPVVGLLRSGQGSTLSLADYESILDDLRPSKAGSYSALLELACGLNSRIDIREPWRSGYRLAEAIRDRLKAPPEERIEIEDLLRRLGIVLVERQLSDESIDAACIGSSAHQPMVVLNTASPNASGPSGRRITLAHELCHLLFDRAGLRSLARFDGGPAESDRIVEMRANAFAVELLVPMRNLIGEDGRVIEEARLPQVAEEWKVSFHALQWHAKNLRNRLLD